MLDCDRKVAKRWSEHERYYSNDTLSQDIHRTPVSSLVPRPSNGSSMAAQSEGVVMGGAKSKTAERGPGDCTCNHLGPYASIPAYWNVQLRNH